QAWDNLTQTAIGEIVEHLVPFTTILDKEDEYARFFDLLILNFQLDMLSPTNKQERFQNKIMKTAAMLEKKSNIPMVSQQLEIIRQVQDKAYWQQIDLLELERIRLALRDLLKFLDRGDRKIVYSDFKDAYEEISIKPTIGA